MVVTEYFRKGLKAIGFQLDEPQEDSNTPQINPIIFVSELYNRDNRLTPFQLLALEKAETFEADAVFFRYFDGEIPPQPQVYIYDNSDNRLKKEYSLIHRELWSSCQIPTFIIIEKTKIKFFDSRKPVSIHSNGKIYTEEIALIDIDKITHYTNVLDKYNAEKFKNGSFWESEVADNNYNYSGTAYKILIDKLKILRRKHNKNSNISKRLFDHVIIIATLIKFLEENGIDDEGNNLASNFFQSSVQCNSFIDILKNNKLVEILKELSNKFNGGIFNLSYEEKIALNNADLKEIIDFFDAKIDNKNQQVLWDLYSFKHIPVELISNIYEEFLPDEDKGAVYTPHFLVNFLIDECLPVPKKNHIDSYNIKTIDVSCGSGIFLVNCFKRLVDIYKVKEYSKTNNLPVNLDITTLQSILKNNIFGIDINEKAVNLTKFSLHLALCQMLSPKQIWTELMFQDLGENNILQRDFFCFVTSEEVKENFDLVIGNPPFNPPLKSNGSSYKNNEYFNEIVTENKLNPYPIKDGNIALLFLQLSTDLLKEKSGLLCLIQPALSLLHKPKNEEFRKELFSNHNVIQIVDFTTLRRILFPSATTPTCAIFIENTPLNNEDITHIVIRRTKPSKEKLYFELDAYDFHTVNREYAKFNYSWKSNLFGGYKLFHLINRILSKINYQKIKDELDKSEKEKITNYSLLKIIEDKTFFKNIKAEKLDGYFVKYFNFLVAFIAGTSSRQGLDRPYDVLKSDFLNLPIIDNNELTKAEIILIKDVVDYKIKEFGNGENFKTNKEIKANKEYIPVQLVEYSKVYLDALNSLYEINKTKFSLKAFYNSSGCFIMEFIYDSSNHYPKNIRIKNSNFTSLIGERKKTLNLKKVSFIHSQNQIFIIKPKLLRYWLKSIALTDFETTIQELINLNLIKE